MNEDQDGGWSTEALGVPRFLMFSLSLFFFIYFLILLFFPLWLTRGGQLSSTATTLRTATVKQVAQKQALEGEGKAFVE